MKTANYVVPLLLLMCTANTVVAKDLRIINGEPIDIESRPWMVGLVNKGSAASDVFCGASLIAPEWVLTAAHCVIGSPEGTIDVVAGASELSKAIPERIAVEKIIMHPDYDDDSIENDIALLKLSSASDQKTVGYKVPASADSVGKLVNVSGWGNLSTTGQQFPTQLHSVDLSISDFASCSAAYGGLPNTQLCATNPGGTKDSCQGDSGGPLVARVQFTDVQVGIVSYGQECASSSHPGVYTRVSQYEKFISDTLGDDEVTTVVDNGDPDDVTEVAPPAVVEPEESTTNDMLAPAEIIVYQDFGRVVVGQRGDALFTVFNDSSGNDVVITNLKITPSTDIDVIENGCDNTELRADEYCDVELAWTPSVQGNFDRTVSVELFDGSSTTTLTAVVSGEALAKIDIGSTLEQPEIDFFTSNNQDWEVDYEFCHVGSESLQTSDMSDMEPVVLEGDFDVDTDSELSYSFTVQGGLLVLYINGEPVSEFETMLDWETTSINVGAGSKVAWEFRPDAQTRVAPKARIDGISLQPLTEANVTNEMDEQLEPAGRGGAAGAGSTGPLSMLFMLSIAGWLSWSRKKSNP